MFQVKQKLLLTLALSLGICLPSFAIDEATRTKLQELLEKAKARQSGKSYSTRDMVNEKETSPVTKPEETKKPEPLPVQAPVINVNQNTEINGLGSTIAQPVREPIIEEPKAPAPVVPSAPKPVAPSKPAPAKAPAVKAPAVQSAPKPAAPSKPTPAKAPAVKAPTAPAAVKKDTQAPQKTKPSNNEIQKIETKNEVKQSPVKNLATPQSSGLKQPEHSSSSVIKAPQEELPSTGLDVLDQTRSVTPAPTEHKTQADRESDYHLVLRKSLKSLEEDSWNEVKYNMGEAKDYFAREKNLYPSEKNIDTYYKLILAFQRFSEAGLELDQGDFADFEEAEALYLDASDILDEVERGLGQDLNSKNIKEIINTVRGYIDEDLDYIEEMIGID